MTNIAKKIFIIIFMINCSICFGQSKSEKHIIQKAESFIRQNGYSKSKSKVAYIKEYEDYYILGFEYEKSNLIKSDTIMLGGLGFDKKSGKMNIFHERILIKKSELIKH